MGSLIIFGIRFLIFLSNIYSWFVFGIVSLFGRVADEDEIDDLIDENHLNEKTPQELQNWIRDNFSYRKDIIDYAKHPLAFLYDKRGDCDDFANFCEIVLPKLGYTNVYTISSMADNKAGHAVCVAEKNGNVFGFGNWNLIYFESHDLEHIGDVVCKRMSGNFWFIVKYENGKFIEGKVK